LLHAQTYIWCRANPTLKVSIFGLLTIPTSCKSAEYDFLVVCGVSGELV
jgi:hypothetical protein